MDQIWYLPNLVTFAIIIGILLWQSISTKDYERKQRQNCEDELDQVRDERDRLALENERLQLLLMGKGINISGGQVTVNRDMVGGDDAAKS